MKRVQGKALIQPHDAMFDGPRAHVTHPSAALQQSVVKLKLVGLSLPQYTASAARVRAVIVVHAVRQKHG